VVPIRATNRLVAAGPRIGAPFFGGRCRDSPRLSHPSVLSPGAHVHHADMLGELGFTEINIRPVRKRNAKKELIEFDVSATFVD
jgi:hypothetical protein